MGDGPPFLEDAELAEIVGARAGALFDLAGRLARADSPDAAPPLHALSRPLLAVILSEASQLEELLDACGALRNRRWRGLRSVVAAMKLFAGIHYKLVHLVHVAPSYHLPPAEGDLAAALLEARRLTGRALQAASRRLLQAAPPGLAPGPANVPGERLPAGRLPEDCPRRHVSDVAGTVARLATALLNLAEDAAALTAERWSAGASDAPDLPEETELRRLAEDFHNLQALYDTHVAHTDAERDDPELSSLRGCASVVYHLLEIATDLTHYHERHVVHTGLAPDPASTPPAQQDCMPPDELEAVLRDCTLAFAARYVCAGRSLGQQLLRRYAEEGEVAAPVPCYRGFHVRPSTLVARIVRHYGSPVSMSLDDETYDAASPMDLFRANEGINAKKRRWLAKEVARLVESVGDRLGDDLGRAVRMVVLRLAEEAKVILYEHPLPPIEGHRGEGQTLLSFVVDAIARLQALGKIDIVATVTATFRGDRRVLADLQLLASSGYGEDAYGNNIALPEPLKYLRR